MDDLKDILEWIQLQEENKLILEFANIGPKSHKFGIDIIFHLMQPGNRKLKHGPRAKFMTRNSDYEFCITISDNPKVIGDWEKIVSKKELNILITNITKFKVPLLNFWYDDKMSTDELVEQMEMIRNENQVEPTYK